MKKAERKPKTIDKTSRAYRYYEGHKKLGKSKKEAAIVAGYAPSTAHAPSVIEKSQEYQMVENHFKSQLEGKITLGEMADALVDNIKQTGEEKIDRGARNKGIEIALEQLNENKKVSDDQVIIILK